MKKIVTIAVFLLCMLTTSCGSMHAGRVLHGELIRQYDMPGEKPYYSTYADGTYYSMCHIYGGFEYNLSVSDTLGQISYLYKTDKVDILGIKANEKYATWVERSKGTGSMEIMAFDKGTQEARSVFRIEEYEGENGEPVLQFPISEIYEDKVFFIDRGDHRDTAVLMEYDLSTEDAFELYTFDEYKDYQPVMKVRGQKLFVPVGDENGLIKIMVEDLVQGEDGFIALPEDVDRVHALDYDTQGNRLCLYYHSVKDNKEKIGFFTMEGEYVSDICTFGERDRLWTDDIRCHGKYVLWNHYKKAKTGREELSSLCSFIAYDSETDTMYDFPGGFDYFLKEEQPYVYAFGYDRVHKLYRVDLP